MNQNFYYEMEALQGALHGIHTASHVFRSGQYRASMQMDQEYPFHDLWQLTAIGSAGESSDEQHLLGKTSAPMGIVPGVYDVPNPLALEVVNIVEGVVDVRSSGLIEPFGQIEDEEWPLEEQRRAA